MKLTSLVLGLLFFGSSANLMAFSDPKNIMPQVDSLLTESFESAFSKNLTYDYSSKTCYAKKNCDKFFMKMKTEQVDKDVAQVTMFQASGEPFGGVQIYRNQWQSFNNNIFRRTLIHQETRYKELVIENLENSTATRYVNGAKINLNTIKVEVSMKNRQNQNIYKIYTLSADVNGFARILKIHEKHYTNELKTIERTAEHIIQN